MLRKCTPSDASSSSWHIKGTLDLHKGLCISLHAAPIRSAESGAACASRGSVTPGGNSLPTPAGADFETAARHNCSGGTGSFPRGQIQHGIIWQCYRAMRMNMGLACPGIAMTASCSFSRPLTVDVDGEICTDEKEDKAQSGETEEGMSM
ncbi:hypothetical protein CYMTET_17093, partial [Cymbomonas tetramitiformis]